MENIWGFTANLSMASQATRVWELATWCLPLPHPSSTQIVDLCSRHTWDHSFQVYHLQLSEGSQTPVIRRHPLGPCNTSQKSHPENHQEGMEWRNLNSTHFPRGSGTVVGLLVWPQLNIHASLSARKIHPGELRL